MIRPLACAALLLATPANALIITTPGIYHVEGDIPAPANAFFYFTGGLTDNFDNGWTTASATAAVDGQTFVVHDNHNCPAMFTVQCNHIGPVATYEFVGYSDMDRTFTVSDLVISGNANDYQLNVSLPYGTLAFGPAVAAVPEVSSWVMMLLGFAGVGFMGLRKQWLMTT